MVCRGTLACTTVFIAVLLLQRDIPNKATSIKERFGNFLTVSKGESVITGQKAWQLQAGLVLKQ